MINNPKVSEKTLKDEVALVVLNGLLSSLSTEVSWRKLIDAMEQHPGENYFDFLSRISYDYAHAFLKQKEISDHQEEVSKRELKNEKANL